MTQHRKWPPPHFKIRWLDPTPRKSQLISNNSVQANQVDINPITYYNLESDVQYLFQPLSIGKNALPIILSTKYKQLLRPSHQIIVHFTFKEFFKTELLIQIYYIIQSLIPKISSNSFKWAGKFPQLSYQPSWIRFDSLPQNYCNRTRWKIKSHKYWTNSHRPHLWTPKLSNYYKKYTLNR